MTPKGRALKQEARQVLRQTEEEWSQQIGEDRMLALKDALRAIIAVIEADRSG